MKTVLLILSALVMFTGCNQQSASLSGKELREKIDECKKYDLDYKLMVNPFSGDTHAIRDVYCYPKTESKEK